MSRRSSNFLPRFIAAALTAPALVAAAVLTAPAALAETTESGPDGQELTVSETELDPDGDTVTVSGADFREDVGIYVALCVIPQEADTAPGLCLGGVNMSGDEESSVWIASDPPAYAEGLTIPFEEGGSFEVEISVSADDGHTDCLDPSVAPDGCAIATRADHTRESDRSADVLIPVTFDGAGDDAASDSNNDSDAADSDEDTTDSDETDDAAETEEPTTETPESDANDSEESADDQSATADSDESAGNTTAITILIIAAIIGLIAGVSAVAYANRKKRNAARAEALDRHAEQDGPNPDDGSSAGPDDASSPDQKGGDQ